MAGKDVSDAASRVRSLLGKEDRRKRRMASMMDRLQAHGWSIPKPARPAQGPTVGDAAQAIEARHGAADALRDEAERQLAAATAESSRGPADDLDSLQFKRDDSISEWRWAVLAMVEYVDLRGESRDLALHADSDIVPILAGIHAYRHLDPRSQRNVLGLINKMATSEYRPDLWPLAGRLQEHVAAAKASPYQSLWSMSDKEISDHIRRRDFLNILDYAGDAQDIGELGLVGAGAANIARSVTIPGAAANGVLLAAKYATKANKAHLESILEERRNGGNPFDRLPAANP